MLTRRIKQNVITSFIKEDESNFHKFMVVDTKRKVQDLQSEVEVWNYPCCSEAANQKGGCLFFLMLLCFAV